MNGKFLFRDGYWTEATSSDPLQGVICMLGDWRWALSAEGLSCSSNGKESACDAGHQGSIPGSGRSSGEGSGLQLQYSCLWNSMDREAWWAIVHGVTKSRTRLND